MTSAETASADTVASNLRTQVVRQVWRSFSDDRAHSWFQASTAASLTSVDGDLHGLALISHNTGANVGTPPLWRIRVDTINLGLNIWRPPASISGLVNLTGVVADIQDDPYNPDVDKLAAVSHTSNTEVLITLPAPSRPLRAGADLQRVHIRVASSAASIPAATVAFELREGGVLKQSISSGTSVSTIAQNIVVSFNASNLTSLTATPQIKVIGTAGASGTVEVHSVVYEPDFTGHVYDSLDTEIELPQGVWYEKADALYLLSTPIELDLTGENYFFHVQFTCESLPDGYVEAGYFELLIDPIDLGPPESGGITLSWQGGATVRYGLGNNPHNKPSPMYRVLEASFTQQLESQAVLVALDQLARDLGTKRDAVFILRPSGTSDFLQATSFFGRFIEGATPRVTHQGYGKGSDGDEPRYTVQFTARESR